MADKKEGSVKPVIPDAKGVTRYLLKPNQVPVNEFLKLKLAYDHRRAQEAAADLSHQISLRRY